MNGVDDMLYMQSTNANDGTMSLTVTFDVDTVPNIDQVNVQNRMAQAAPNLPPEVNQFGLTMRKQTGLPMLIVSLYSPNRSYDALFLANYANINVLDAIYRVPGVGEARIFGAGDYAMRVWVKPDLLARLGLTVPDVSRAIQQQSTVNPSGQVGSNPAPAGQEMTYTVRSQGRLQTEEEFGAIAVRSNPDGSVIRLRDIARIELGALNYQQIGRVNGQPGCAIAVFQAPGSNALGVVEGVRKQMAELQTRFPADLQYAYTLDTTLAVSQGIREIVITLSEAMLLVVLGRVPVPSELARDADSGCGRAGVPHRDVHGVPCAWILGEHAVAVRSRARHWPRRRRCDCRRRGGGASHRGGHGSAGRDAQSDGGGVRAGRQHRADPRVRLHSGRVHGRDPGEPQQAVRDHDCHLGADLGVQCTDAVAGSRGDVAAAAEGGPTARRLLPSVQPRVREGVAGLHLRQPRADSEGRRRDRLARRALRFSQAASAGGFRPASCRRRTTATSC